MSSRRTRGRNHPGIRITGDPDCPSHVSALAHVVHQVHVARPAAHVEKLPETHKTESTTSIDSEQGRRQRYDRCLFHQPRFRHREHQGRSMSAAL